jgi:hypothetical protein
MMKVIPVRQKFPVLAAARRPRGAAEAVPADVKPGARIAVGAGSRGITNLSAVIGETIRSSRKRAPSPSSSPRWAATAGRRPKGRSRSCPNTA